ncbi:MAG TPA: hypothetical protein VFM06_09320 [Candidatus Limnocylindria bacterium]|nr:hypothetical protein [Candidatus Limnocylindria bacterium]
MSDRSFVRFGGLAAILLALTSWAAVLTFYTAAAGGQDLVGVEMFRLFSALIAFWSLFAIVAVHWVVRPHGEAWSFFAVIVGVTAAAATFVASLYPIAFTRHLLRDPIDVNVALPTAVPPTDPLNAMTFGLTGLWFLIANLLLSRAAVPRRLALLGLVGAIVLLGGFLAALMAQDALVDSVALAAGAVVGPVYWLWLGFVLRRMA